MDFFIGLVMLVLLLAVVGFLVHLITTHVPMSDLFKQVITLAVVVCVVIYILLLITGRVALPSLSMFGAR